MMDDFMKLLRKKAEKQGGPKEGPEMKAKASMAKAMSDALSEDITDDIEFVTHWDDYLNHWMVDYDIVRILKD